MNVVGDHSTRMTSSGSARVSGSVPRRRHGLKRPSNVTMSGVVFGGAIGAFIGGPVGAVVGIAVGGIAGEVIERYFPSDDAQPDLG